MHCPRLPSCNGAQPPTASLPDDVNCVREVIAGLVESGERVLLVMHSSGGIVGTDASTGLSISERQATGATGGIIHLVYLCAYLLQPGTSVLDIINESGSALLLPQFVHAADDGTTFPVDPVRSLLGGMDQRDIDAALPHLVRFPASAMATPAAGDAWRRIPITYVHTTDDYAVFKSFQDIMLRKVRENGVEVKTAEYESNHSVFLTKREEMGRVVVAAAQDTRNSV